MLTNMVIILVLQLNGSKCNELQMAFQELRTQSPKARRDKAAEMVHDSQTLSSVREILSSEYEDTKELLSNARIEELEENKPRVSISNCYWGAYFIFAYGNSFDELSEILQCREQESDLFLGRVCRILSWKVMNPIGDSRAFANDSTLARNLLAITEGNKGHYTKIESLSALACLAAQNRLHLDHSTCNRIRIAAERLRNDIESDTNLRSSVVREVNKITFAYSNRDWEYLQGLPFLRASDPQIHQSADEATTPWGIIDRTVVCPPRALLNLQILAICVSVAYFFLATIVYLLLRPLLIAEAFRCHATIFTFGPFLVMRTLWTFRRS